MIKIRKNVSDHIYDFIKEDILRGTLNFGDKIVEIDYSNKLDVSRTPLREAIKKLEIEGLIVRLANGRLRIMEMNNKKIEEIFEIRIALENILLGSLDNYSEELPKIKENLYFTKLQLNAENWNAARQLFSDYNNLFYRISDLEFTIKILKNYDFIISKLRSNSLKSPERMNEAYEEHLKIFECLMNKDIEEAKRLNKIHLINSKNSILLTFNNN